MIKTLLLITGAMLQLVGIVHAFESIAGYDPTTDVIELSAIDLEQQAIEELLLAATNVNDFQSAQAVYEQGNSAIRSLSSTDDKFMRNADGEFFPEFQMFIAYYGQSNYGDDFITSAFDGSATTSGYTGNFDFSQFDLNGRAEAVKKSTVLLSMAMCVLWDLEVAVAACVVGCAGCGSLHSLDEAVALYVGSLEGSTGSGDGLLMYAAADRLCQYFKTCGSNGESGTSRVNINIMSEFASMQQNLLLGQCAEAITNKAAITNQLLVPFVQGTLKSAYHLQSGTTSDIIVAEGAIYAAAVLPVVNGCNFKDAKKIFDSMRPGGTLDFATVKAAFELHYDCMGVTCKDVGGLWDKDSGRYFTGAEPCGAGS